ncbi:MAG: 3-deoxy-D-manno-octulosonic acid transferase, partial [Bacteroidetes bacterium]
NQKVIVCGSTWPQDEKILIPAFAQLKSMFKVKMIIAPHHPDEKNIDKIINLLKQHHLSYQRYTQISNEQKHHESDVLVIDTIGILNKIYRYGYLAYIGGGFSDGIHNILEPAVYGLPVVFGKKYQKFYEAVELIKMKGAYNIKDKEELIQVFQMLLKDEHHQYRISQNAVKNFIEEHKGSVQKTMAVLNNYM